MSFVLKFSYCIFLIFNFFASCMPSAQKTERNSPEAPKEIDKNNKNAPTEIKTELDAWKAAEDFCSNDSSSEKRKAAQKYFATYEFGRYEFSSSKQEETRKSQQQCANFFLPTAIAVNVQTGYPVSALLGQAIQETNFEGKACNSKLAREAFNLHGQKKKIAASGFTYWKGEGLKVFSTESTTGSGNLQQSEFMKFSHPEFSFYSVAERLVHPEMNAIYGSCWKQRANATEFIKCVGKKWAVHTTYAEAVLSHASKLNLTRCNANQAEWVLKNKFQ